MWARAVGHQGEMTTRALLTGLLRHGKAVLRKAVKEKIRDVQVKVARADQTLQVPQRVNKVHSVWQKLVPNVHVRNFAFQYARQAAWRHRRSNVTLLSFMGLVVAQNQQEKEDKITENLRNFVKTPENSPSTLMQNIQSLSLDLFDFGNQIGQGCNAAVYEARLKQENAGDLYQEDSEQTNSIAEEPEQTATSELGTDLLEAINDTLSEADSDLTVLSFSDDDFEDEDKAPNLFTIADSDFDDLAMELSDDDISVISESEDETFEHVEDTGVMSVNFSMVDALERVEVKGSDGSVTFDDSGGNSLIYLSIDSTTSNDLNDSGTVPKFDLAVKMMFNYGAESNAGAIMREMERETVPARLRVELEDTDLWGNSNRVRKKRLPPHPNLVEMWGVFVDPVPHLPDSLMNYPAALPSRINPEGIGRNMTLFLVMKKYQCTLKEYVSVVHLSFRERLLLLTQLLEVVAHLGQHGVAHRDMKSDNILLDTSTPGSPRLVLSDFGCCLADPQHGLKIPFPTDYIDRGGNTALMAPEIITAQPGNSTFLDYTKADVWGVGALAYEILGADNPFYSSLATTTGSRLNSATYRETQLPPLPTEIPELVKNVVTQMLCRDPQRRPSARQAANILHTILWTPDQWKIPSNQVSRSDVSWWVITMATEVLLETKWKKSDMPEINLKRLFVQNFNINNYYEYLSLVQDFETRV